MRDGAEEQDISGLHGRLVHLGQVDARRQPSRKRVLGFVASRDADKPPAAFAESGGLILQSSGHIDLLAELASVVVGVGAWNLSVQ